jgi:hypothetical protein
MPPYYPDEAISAQTSVEKVDGQWRVYVEVVFPDEVRRREVGCYYSEKRARVAAKWIQYGVNINWEDSSQDLEP